MRTEQEILEEVQRLAKVKNLDASGLMVRIVTLIALEWAIGANQVPPSQRLTETCKDMFTNVVEK